MKEIEEVRNSVFSELTDKMHEYIDTKKLPGFIGLIYQDGKIVYCETFGKADIKNDWDMSLDSIVRIYSMTKPITVIAALMLYEEGKFALHDPISNWITEAKNLRVYAGEDNGEIITEELDRPLTIFDLLTHTSGSIYAFNPNHAIDKKYIELFSKNIYNLTLKEAVEILFKIPLKFQPGSKWAYGYSIDILGYLVELLSDQTLDEFFKERIFDKLGMKDTAFHVPHDKIARFAEMYKKVDDAFVIQKVEPEDRYTKKQKLLMGGAGLVSTLQDYFQFALMLLNRGVYEGGRLLKEETLDLMMQDQISSLGISIDFEGFGENIAKYIKNYGFGLGVQVKTQSSEGIPAGVSGWCGVANTDFWVDPDNKILGIFLSQFMPLFAYPVFNEFRELSYKGINLI
jgi:CubicO group peptidase (beta-lactamase class C family)